MMMSLAETSGGGGAAAQLDSDTLDEVMAMQRSGNMNQEEELEMALRLSQQQVYFYSIVVFETHNIQKQAWDEN